jgi:PIN domain nuclease of toxin-antitoxin system
LTATATAAIRQASSTDGIAIASISLVEMAMLIVRGRVVTRGTPESWLMALVDQTNVIVKDVTPAVAVIATQFPDDFPGDPADRLIAATARVEGVPLVTRDVRLRVSPAVRTVW